MPIKILTMHLVYHANKIHKIFDYIVLPYLIYELALLFSPFFSDIYMSQQNYMSN